MTIHELPPQIKRTLERLNSREVYILLIIVLVGFGSFGLGRLSRLEEAKLPIRLEGAASGMTADSAAAFSSVAAEGAPPPAQATGAVPRQNDLVGLESGGKLVASKSGAKYHFPWCSGAQRISEANKIWFNSVEEARKAGYTPASNCKGLK